MILEKLRATTRQQHLQVEQSMTPLFQSIETQEHYAVLLRLFYGFYKPLQDLIDGYIDAGKLPDYSFRRKAEWILDDLDYLGDTDTISIVSRNLPYISSASAAMGALYVLEGSTLGGRIISQLIQEKLPGIDGRSLSFFQGYKTETGKKWTAFLEALHLYSGPAQSEELIRAANETFEKLGYWINEYSSQIKAA